MRLIVRKKTVVIFHPVHCAEIVENPGRSTISDHRLTCGAVGTSFFFPSSSFVPLNLPFLAVQRTVGLPR